MYHFELILVAGQLDKSRMKEYLYGPLLEVEVHDRDRLIHKFEEGRSLFGEERDDDFLSFPNTGLHFNCEVLLFLRAVCSRFFLYLVVILESHTCGKHFGTLMWLQSTNVR